ncbi:FG-GAP and VCBS repeat-containing protein [Streptomyces sparsogenes]|uniref:FG-GAP and VCBS repeat-containing protein n=1 Tax=Streptomyces sparsogenes TaxID=67365 RepID=UPI00331B4C24
MRHRSISTVVRCATVAALLTAPALLAAPAAGAAEPRAASGSALAGVAPRADFDKDGYPDLVVAAPAATVGGKTKAGYFAVVYGSAAGANTAHRQVISQATEGVPGDPEAGGWFGYHTVARDLDGDGYTDLAVDGAGTSSVTVLWGSASGLTTAVELPASAATNGANLTGGDFNGDGHADLVAHSTDDTNLRVLYGPFTRDGAPASANTLNTDRTFGPVDLIAGDIDGDGRDDLVSTHAFEEMSEASLYWKSGADGLGAAPTRIDHAAAGTIGDVDKDGYGDLVIRTVPGNVVEDLPYDHGTIKVLYGSPSGPGATRTKVIDQNTTGVPGVNEDGDQFGYSLSAGDVNGDGYADIAVGIPYEDLDGGVDAGSTVLLYGGASGLSGAGAQAFTQDTAGVPGAAEAGDHFGAAVRLGDTDGDGKADLAAGAPDEDGTYTSSGAAWVLRGGTGGLTTTGVVSFGPNALGAPEAGAELGRDFGR